MHRRTFWNLRATAVPDQNLNDFEIILGKVRPFTSPSPRSIHKFRSLLGTGRTEVKALG